MPNARKVALVNPPFSKLVYGDEHTIKSVTPCLGLFYLQSYCRDLAEVEVFEGEFFPTFAQLVAAVRSFSPDVLGVTTNTSTYPLCRQLAREVEAPVSIVGGPYATFRVNECAADFDVVFCGDAELSLHAFLSGAPRPEVPGIAFRGADGRVVRTPARTVGALDEIPFPDHRDMQLGLYQASPHRELAGKFATMVTTRGCGFQCTFCLSARGGMNDGAYRVRSVANVLQEVRVLTESYGVRSIQFWDDTFTMDRGRTRDLCRALATTGIDYVCNTRTDRMDAETADLLAGSGCRGVFFGVESGDQEISTRGMRKGVRNEQVRKAFAACRAAGIRSTGSFILGAIDDTEDTVATTVDFALELDPDYVLFNVYTAHPGTAGWKEALARGVIDDYTVDTDRWQGEPAGVPTVCRAIDRRMLHRLKAEAYVRYYSRRDSAPYQGIIDTYRREIARLDGERTS